MNIDFKELQRQERERRISSTRDSLELATWLRGFHCRGFLQYVLLAIVCVAIVLFSSARNEFPVAVVMTLVATLMSGLAGDEYCDYAEERAKAEEHGSQLAQLRRAYGLSVVRGGK